MPSRPRAAAPRSKALRPARAAPSPPPPPPPASRRGGARPLLAERPHAHIVCRSCGRIAPLALETEEELRLEAISSAAPEGWTVDLVAFSLTGACPRCRQGPLAP